MVIQDPAAFSCWTERCVRQKPRLLLTYTTNRPYKLLGNNHQEVLFNQNPISNLDPWVERNDNFPTAATGLYRMTF